MTGIAITFTCTCTGTQDGCGTLALTDDVNTVMDWSSDAWNANSITGTGTITFIEEDKGQRTFTCGSNSQSKSSAQSTLDVVG